MYLLLKNILLLLLFVLTGYLTEAQPKFKVVHLPRKTAYSKDQLNNEISNAREKETVRKIIRKKNFPSAQLIIQIDKGKNKYSWWTFNTTTGYEREDNDIILQSKTGRIDAVGRPSDSTVIIYTKPLDLNNELRDTLLLLSPIYLKPASSPRSPIESWETIVRCGDNTEINLQLPVVEHKFMLDTSLAGSCEQISKVSLYHSTKPAQLISRFFMKKANNEEKEMLLSIADHLQKSDPKADVNSIATTISSYSSKRPGKYYYPQLVNWLRKNMQ